MLNIETSLRILSLAIFGVAAGASQTYAQSVNVPFNATVGNACAFSAVVGGSLAQVNSGRALASTDGITGLVPTYAGGTAGSVVVNCLGGGNITVTPPTGTAPTSFNPQVSQSVVELASTGAKTSAAAGSNLAWTLPTGPIAVPAGAETLNVGMFVGRTGAGANLPTGTYQYTVSITVTPN
jgi:hypothetical protein